MRERKRWIVDLSVVGPTWANWTSPVVVKVNRFRQEMIVNPAEALVFLRNSWPLTPSVQAEEAARLRSEVLRRRVTAEVARTAFLTAAAEADILL